MIYLRPSGKGDSTISDAAIGWGALLNGRNGWRTLALAGGVTLHAVNLYIAATILPSVVNDIGGLPFYAWNTTAFEICSILGSACSVRLLQRAGPRGAYITAFGVFATGTLGCALAPAMPVMVAARAVQGLGGGMLFALSFSMIRLFFDEPLWARAMAAISGMWGVAVLVGPAVGGAFAEHGAWRGAFLCVLPIAGLFVALALAVLPRRAPGPADATPIQLMPLGLLAAALIAIATASVLTDPVRQIGCLAATIGLGVLFVRSERRARSRLLPRGAFRGTLGALYATLGLTTITITVAEIFIPLFLQVLHRQSSLVAGYLGATMAAGWTLASLASAGATGRGATRTILAIPILTLAGMIGLFLLVPQPTDGGWGSIAAITAALFILGCGVGVGWPHLLARVLVVADKDEQDLAAASLTTVQLIVSALGAAVSGLVANLAGLTDPGGVTGTGHAALWLFGLFAMPPALAVWTAIRCTHQNREP